MRNVKIERIVAATQTNVWAVLSDYPNIADWNSGVKNSYSIGDVTEGVGAQRQCDLEQSGVSMRETVVEWVPEERMVIDIDKVEKMPINRARMTFTLSSANPTHFTMSYDYEPKGGPLAVIFGPLLDRMMIKGFNGFIDYLEPAAQAHTTT